MEQGKGVKAEFVKTVQRLPGDVTVVNGRNNLDGSMSLILVEREKATFQREKAVPVTLLFDIRKDIAERAESSLIYHLYEHQAVIFVNPTDKPHSGVGRRKLFQCVTADNVARLSNQEARKVGVQVTPMTILLKPSVNLEQFHGIKPPQIIVQVWKMRPSI